MKKSISVSKQKLLFGVIYAIFIFSEQMSDDLSFISTLSNTLDNYKIKYLAIIAGIAIMGVQYIKNNKLFARFRTETRSILIAVGVLTVITVLKQAANGFKSFSYEEIFFLIMPIVFVYLIVNCTNKDIGEYINIAFTIQYIFFFINIIGNFSISNVLAINFIDSYSPFESEYSFYGVVFFCYYIYKNDKKKSLLSLIMVFLAFKRAALVFCLIILVASFIKKAKWTHTIPPKTIVNIAIVIFIVAPLAFDYIYSKDFSKIFNSLTNLDFNEFTSERYERINLCLNNKMSYGLGSTTDFLTRNLSGDIDRNLHNDVLRIYLECTILGSIAFSVGFFNITRKSTMSFVLMSYLFFDMMFNHFIGAGRAAFWIIIYLAIYCFNNNSNHNLCNE